MGGRARRPCCSPTSRGSTEIRRASSVTTAPTSCAAATTTRSVPRPREHLGEAVKGTGDGLMIVFPAAAEAVAGAVAIQRSISRLSRNLPTPLGVRVGISAGDVSWEGDDCFGTPVVEAARLCDAAQEGQILASEVVRLLAGSRGGHRLESGRHAAAEGLGEMAAYEVAWDAGPTESAPLPPALSTSETLPLIGRVDEREALTTAWKRALEGTPQTALIAGEPGVGKTRLAAELARGVSTARARSCCSADVTRSSASPTSRSPRRSPPTPPAATTTCCSRSSARQAATSPASSRRSRRGSPSLPEPMRADPETERYRLFEAVTALLSAIAADGPGAARGRRPALGGASRRCCCCATSCASGPSNGSLVVATYRDTDLGRGHPLSEALADLRREPDVERVVLRGLDEAEVVEMVSTAAGHELEGEALELARAVHAETEGNPFFVGQVLRHLAETGAIRVEDGRWVVSDRTRVGIPEGRARGHRQAALAARRRHERRAVGGGRDRA